MLAPFSLSSLLLYAILYSSGAKFSGVDHHRSWNQVLFTSLEENTRMTFTLAATAFVLFLTRPALGLEKYDKTVVNVTVYYEALCSDSVRFITQQLEPSYEGLKDHLNIDFVPYGKASQSKDKETGQWIFDCQHGPAECRGNRDQACALHAINEHEELAKRQNLSVSVVICVMRSNNLSTAITQCAEKENLRPETRTLLNSCRNSSLGNDLLARHGDKTMQLNPALTFVPTITVNGLSNATARKNFKGFICGLIPQEERPESCKSTS